MKRGYKQNLLETFYYIVTNSFTSSLDSDKKYYEKLLRTVIYEKLLRTVIYEKLLRTVILFIENIFYNRFGKSALNKQLWWYVFVICKIELVLMSALSYRFVFIQQILC